MSPSGVLLPTLWRVAISLAHGRRCVRYGDRPPHRGRWRFRARESTLSVRHHRPPDPRAPVPRSGHFAPSVASLHTARRTGHGPGCFASALSPHCPSAGLAYTRACRGFGATGGFLQASLSARGHVRPRKGGFRCVSRARTADSSPDGRASPDPRTDGAPRRRRWLTDATLSRPVDRRLRTLPAVDGATAGPFHRPRTTVHRRDASVAPPQGRLPRALPGSLAYTRLSDMGFRSCAFPPHRLSHSSARRRDCSPPPPGSFHRRPRGVHVPIVRRDLRRLGVLTPRARRSRAPHRAPATPRPESGPLWHFVFDSVPLDPQPGIPGYIGGNRCGTHDGEPYPINGSKKGGELASSG